MAFKLLSTTSMAPCSTFSQIHSIIAPFYQRLSLALLLMLSLFMVAYESMATGGDWSTMAAPARFLSPDFVNAAIDRDLSKKQALPSTFLSLLANISKVCHESQYLRVVKNMPKNHFQANGETFPYYFEYVLKDRNRPTIVFIPGGPGSGSIGQSWGDIDYNLVFFDPRGVGCNYGTASEFPPNLLTTQQHVQDLLTVLKGLQLSNFVIYGVSYGTMVATELAPEISATENLMGPKAIILESTLGKTFEPGGWMLGMTTVVNSFLKENPHLADLFKGDTMPLGLSEDFWANYYLPRIGWNWQGTHYELSQLYRLSQGESIANTLLERIKNRSIYFEKTAKSRQSIEPEVQLQDYVTCTIGCQEIDEGNCREPLKYKLQDGKLLVTSGDWHALCPKSYQQLKMITPFDSSNFDLVFPTYYFQGDADPYTPIEGARYHFEKQKEKRSSNNNPIVFQTFHHLGHVPFNDLLTLNKSCWLRAMSAIFSAQKDLSQIFDAQGKCLVPSPF